MIKLSNNYFLSLQEKFIDFILKNLHCGKKKLTIKKFNENLDKLNLPNLTTLKICDESKTLFPFETHLIVKKLFTFNKLCSKIKELDLSQTGLNDNGLFRLTKNISAFKNIQIINLKDCNITTYSEKYITQLKKRKIKIISSELKQMKKESYGIILG